MLLLFRFILIMIASRFRPQLAPLEESVVRFTALPWDCDLNIHLNAGRFMSFMDMARIELLGRMRLVSKLIQRRWRPLAGGCVVRYRRSIEPFQRFDIRTRILGWDSKWYYMEQRVERNGELCATGVTRLIIRGPNGNVPPSEVNGLASDSDVPSPELPEFVLRWREMEDAR